jgi:hypothetical protein
VVFGDEVNRQLQEAYPQVLLRFFDDDHRMQLDPEKYRQLMVIFFKQWLISLQ